MKRGDLFRVHKPGHQDPKKYRTFVVVGRQTIISSKFSTIMCAPVYSRYDGLSTQVAIGTDEGLKHESAIHCDELVSILKSRLTHFVGSLSEQKVKELNKALSIALELQG
jgi:mRNA interferase MazF